MSIHFVVKATPVYEIPCTIYFHGDDGDPINSTIWKDYYYTNPSAYKQVLIQSNEANLIAQGGVYSKIELTNTFKVGGDYDFYITFTASDYYSAGGEGTGISLSGLIDDSHYGTIAFGYYNSGYPMGYRQFDAGSGPVNYSYLSGVVNTTGLRVLRISNTTYLYTRENGGWVAKGSYDVGTDEVTARITFWTNGGPLYHPVQSLDIVSGTFVNM